MEGWEGVGRGGGGGVFVKGLWALGRGAHALLAAKSRGPEATAPVPQEKKGKVLPLPLLLRLLNYFTDCCTCTNPQSPKVHHLPHNEVPFSTLPRTQGTWNPTNLLQSVSLIPGSRQPH